MPRKGRSMARLPKLPSLLDRKIYKTGQTRGADDDQVFQNRVGRNSTVLIPIAVWRAHQAIRQLPYASGYIVLVTPPDYFEGAGAAGLLAEGIEVGRNALIFYELRAHWNQWNPQQHGLRVPSSRTAPLGGHYVARIANTTADADERINHGYTSTGLKGAGIRLYEYAPLGVIQTARIQLEALFWLADDSVQTCIEVGMTKGDVDQRRKHALDDAANKGLLDYDALREARTIDQDNKLVCPLCVDFR